MDGGPRLATRAPASHAVSELMADNCCNGTFAGPVLLYWPEVWEA